MAMDAKDLRTEPALSERNNDSSKYSQSGGIALHCDRNKSYQDIGSNSLPKAEVQSARPCAVIGPDRVVPPNVPSESYIKKGSSEPWPCMDNTYHTRRPPEYPHKLANFQNPTRNISPRQTFQENMQRILVPPSYNTVKISEDTNYTQLTERSNVLPKNIKINVPSEAKFCDVPYTVFPPNNEQKNVRNPDMCLPNVNPNLTRTGPHGWPSSVNVRPRTFGAPELYQYQDYASCAGPRPVVPRPNRTGPEEPGYVYAEPFYHQDGNIQFKPYPTAKERFPQQRYDYVSNYANSFHPQPAFPSHKYELQKPVPPHPYPPYPPIKYVDRVSEHVIDGYQRNQQGSYNISYRNQLIHPNFGPVLGSIPQNKIHSYPPDGHIKTVGPNKIPYDSTKGYIEYENGRPKMYPQSESYLVNEMGRMHPMKSQVIMPNYSSINMHNIPPNQYYKKDSQPIKNYEYIQAQFRTMDPNMNMHNPITRHQPIFSPNSLTISPTDSSASNDTSQTLGIPHEDCGYASQSSTASIRSIDSGMNRMPNEYIRKYYDSRFGPIIRNSVMMSKSELTSTNSSKEKKNLNVRQFLQMWNEGDEETEENIPKGIIAAVPKSDSNFGKTNEAIHQANQEQLYVLGLVNVPSEELDKYEHIEKVSKLPENIKGYNHIELLNQFEEAIESSNITNYKTSKDFQMATKVVPVPHNKGTCALPSRPLSPLDVEAKISQSVIHKEVGCNFEIKPCSPKMLNVEMATPVQNILSERVIEKVANPVMLKSPRFNGVDENMDCNILKTKDHRLNINNETIRIPSCKMVNTQFSNNNAMDSIKNSYSLQDLESNSGICLASLPRLDNDIELNFPEVNQQFINANKRDSSCLTTSPKDLPALELLEQSDSQSKNKLNDLSALTREGDNLKSPCVTDSEKEFSKLSKYRKTRAHSSVPKENIHAVRTNSVIIKNPDNVKNYEEHSLSPNPLIKQINNVQQAPINLTSEGNITDNSNNISFITEECDKNKERESSTGIAIDFSLKTTSNENGECMNVNTKETETLSRNNSETSTSILENHASKLPTYSESHQNDCSNLDKGDESVLNPERYSNTETVNETDSIDDTPLEESLTKNEFELSDTSVNEAKEESLLPVTCVKDGSDENSNSLLPIDFVTPPVELLRTTDSNSGDYLMDIDKNIGIPITILESTTNNKTSSTKVEVEDLKNRNSHVKDNIDSYSKDAKVLNIEENIESESNVDASKEDDINGLLKVTEMLSTKNSDSKHCNNIEWAKEETNRNLKLETTDPNSDLPSPHNSSADNLHSEIVDRETHANFEPSTTNSVIEHNGSDYQSEITERKTGTNIDNSPNNTNSVNKESLEKSEQASKDPTESIERNFFTNFILPSPNHVVKSKKDDPVETINGEGDSNYYITTLTSTDMNTQGDISAETLEVKTISNLNVSFPNNTYVSELSQSGTDSNVTDVLSLNATYDGNNIKINNMKGRDENDGTMLLKKETDHVKDTLCIDDTPNKTLLFENTEVKSTNQLNDKEVQDNRYLSYGSKEMYSPTIQKLLMFCEGNILTNLKINFDHEIDSICALSEVEIDRENILDDFGNSNDSTAQYKNDITEDSTSPVISISEIMNFSNTPLTKKHPEYEEHEESSGNSEDINNIIKMPKIYNTDTLLNHKESNISDSCKDNSSRDNYITSPCPINVTNFTYNMENYCNKFDTGSNLDRTSCSLPSDIHEQSAKRSRCTVEITKQDGQYNATDNCPEQLYKNNESNDEISQQLQKNMKYNEINYANKVPVQWNKNSKCYNEISKQLAKIVINNKETLKKQEQEPNWNDEMQLDRQSDSNDEVHRQHEKESNCSNEVLNQCNEESGENVFFETNEQFQECHKQPNYVDEISKENGRPGNGKSKPLDQPNKQSNCNEIEPPITTQKNVLSCSQLQSTEDIFLSKNRQPLKRSLSDSALNVYNNESLQQENEEGVHFIWPFKRRKMNSVDNDVLAQNLCNIIQSNRRNSISTIYNEENVSFCILIDNSCIIAEEESDEQEKICYTELNEECLAEVQNDCIKDDENIDIIPEIISNPEQEENHCEYSDSYVLEGEDGKLEESWVEDVACVETVISDDIAEDIEIIGPSSPKEDDNFSENDESGIFSSSDHTDKVKYIYGDKMCNDDAQFVETLYNTPQMDVNKTLIERETLIAGEYYDNDSLEKILSESNDQDQIPYMSAYSGPEFTSRVINVKQTVENKENMALKTKSTIENVVDAEDVVDTGILKIDEENENIGLLNKTQDDTVHSCESSIDNVFTYRENDENTRYISSSSPEVSSTTSEEKSSAILLKITNYKGSRISQINESSRNNQSPSCKFTEDKDYVQSHANFPSHRPLLTKAAQKYIPPLKESIRDLKVKLSLPQHSLIKLKQLKKSKDEPKVCKQSISVPKISMKPKPKFEDVLKSIDEIQFKMHKEKTKKSKKFIPKVVIKKNENGSHYASTSNKNEFNPDLTGRKWQPWVFIEKNHFIDKMAIKKKTNAVYSHRKQTYVLAEKFQKYKSVNSAAKFVISPPLSDCPSTGLKYTIRLKHNY